jgi:predicted kinase
VNRAAEPRLPARWTTGAGLRLPDPCLLVLVGAAGAGKSTLAARLFAPDAILSSDANRALLTGDASDQGATQAAFAILHRQLDRRLADRRTAVVDATNVTPFARRGLVRRAVAHGIPAVAVVLDLDPTLVLAQNATRPGRIVPESAVQRQLADLERSLRRGSLEGEGFEAVHVLRTRAELDDLSVEWLGPDPAAT